VFDTEATKSGRREALGGKTIDSNPIIAIFSRLVTQIQPVGNRLAELILERSARLMTLIDIVLILILVGLVMWLVDTYIPMAAGIKSLLNVVVFVVVLVWVLQAFGVVGSLPIRVPPVK
jgi:hypothetical protein